MLRCSRHSDVDSAVRVIWLRILVFYNGWGEQGVLGEGVWVTVL